MNSRERVQRALSHREPDRVPVDLGGSDVTGMHASVVYKLRQALGLDAAGTPVKVIEPYQMLGEIDVDLLDFFGADVVPLASPTTIFGFKNEGWKPWTMFDGTPVLVPEGFNTEPEPNGDILLYPEGDRSAPPSGRMPRGGWYFDAITHRGQPALEGAQLNIEDNLEEFGPIAADELGYFGQTAERLYSETDRAILFSVPGLAFGDVSLVPTPWLKHPRGIRDVEEWYISLAARKAYVYRIFERQCEIGLANLARLYEAVGNRVTAAFTTGTDFGMQTGLMISPKTYRKLFKPFHKLVNDWIHEHTAWYTFIHTCGAVRSLIPDLIEAGFDILNPVQCSAAGMDPGELKRDFGDRISFWGGGVDTQHTLPFGTPDEVGREVRQRIRALGRGGGLVFNTIHNVQPLSPVENVLAVFETVQKYGSYPL
jgi:hypothetical protein